MSITKGTIEGVKLAVNVGAMLLVFLSIIALLNDIMWLIGDIFSLNVLISESTNFDNFSIEFVLGYLFAPLMWLIGVTYQECALMGQLLGVKIVSSEFVAFVQLAELKNINTMLVYSKSQLQWQLYVMWLYKFCLYWYSSCRY